MDSRSFASNMYYEEANAFVRWMGKIISDSYHFERVKQYLPRSFLDEMLPEQFKLWEDDIHSPPVNSDHSAVSINTLGQITMEEIVQYEQGEEPSFPIRRLFPYWERNEHIGALSIVDSQIGLLESDFVKYDTSIFFIIENAFPRISNSSLL